MSFEGDAPKEAAPEAAPEANKVQASAYGAAARPRTPILRKRRASRSPAGRHSRAPSRVACLRPLSVGLAGMAGLRRLSLDLSGCPSVSEFAGFEALSLLAQLQDCRLRCRHTGLRGLMSLGQGLGSLRALQILWLDFGGCTFLADLEGLRALRHLAELQELRLDFGAPGNAGAVRDTAALGPALGGMPRLERLSLDFGGCALLRELAGLEPLGRLGRLTVCELSFARTAVKDLRALGASLCGAQQLERLSLNFEGCEDLADLAGLDSLRRLAALRACTVVLSRTPITSTEALASALGCCPELRSLTLELAQCGGLSSAKGLRALGGLQKLQRCGVRFERLTITDAKANSFKQDKPKEITK